MYNLREGSRERSGVNNHVSHCDTCKHWLAYAASGKCQYNKQCWWFQICDKYESNRTQKVSPLGA